MPAVQAADAEIVVVHDADVWCEELPAAVQAVRDGAPWAMPHDAVYRLTELATTRLIGGESGLGVEFEEPAYQGRWGGGIVVAPRETLLEIPLDPRFVGWGSEDQAWAIALTYLAGEGWRGSAPLTHLWHPPQERLTRQFGCFESKALLRRYADARRAPALMRELIEEAKT